MGVPVMTMEFAVGRASRKSIIKSFQELEKPGQKWHLNGYLGMAGNYILMMFYTTVTGWMLYYFYQMLTGKFQGKNTEQVGQMFQDMLSSPQILSGAMIIIVVAGIFICSIGLQKGVEKVTKIMIDSLNPMQIKNKKLRNYMIKYLAMMMIVSSALLVNEGSPKNLQKRENLWKYLKDRNKAVYKNITRRKLGYPMQFSSKSGRKIIVWGYNFFNRIYGFN